MPRGLALFLARLASNPNRDLFTVRLGVALFLGKFGIVGVAADLVGAIIRPVLGLLIEEGTFRIDIGLDAYKEGQKLAEFKERARAEYTKAMARKYTEAEKAQIRETYRAIISRVGIVGNPKP